MTAYRGHNVGCRQQATLQLAWVRLGARHDNGRVFTERLLQTAAQCLVAQGERVTVPNAQLTNE